MTLSFQSLRDGVAAWKQHRADDPENAERLLRQPAYFLVLQDDAARFVPLRHLIAWTEGKPFSQKSGRSISMINYAPALTEFGLARVNEASPFFARIWLEWEAACLSTGKPIANYIGSDPKAGREFWIAPFAL